MLKINRYFYLNEHGNEKTSNYMAIKEIVNKYLKVLKNGF